MRNIHVKSNLARRESVKETEGKGQRQEGTETIKYNIMEAKIKKKEILERREDLQNQVSQLIK